MREKIFGILYELIFADNLATTWKIKCHKASTNIDSLVNQEVEKRIAERMPSEEDAQNAESRYEDEQNEDKLRFDTEYCYRDFMAGTDWLRSLLTCSEIPNNSKTEGGGE